MNANAKNIKTEAELKDEVPVGGTRFDKATKVIAHELGYADFLRQPGDVFYVPAGTIVGPNNWFQPVDGKTATTEETDELEALTVPELKVKLSEAGVDFAGVNKKADLVALLASAQGGDDLA